jgi:hypothetical protein
MDNTGNMKFISEVSQRDHSDVHYLYKLRKALVILAGEENLSGYTNDQLKEIHSSIASALILNGGYHYYDDYCDDLDESLSEDLKKASSGYYPKKETSLFNLEEKLNNKLNDVMRICEEIKKDKSENKKLESSLSKRDSIGKLVRF